jgi:DNA helicase-2/ATP-dependent DNA helicase PcrA
MRNTIAQLNATQQEAVTHIDGAMLILAGAGSGKTKTLTTRLAFLIGEVGIPPSSTLTLTFTNKASQEMRERALALLKTDYNTPPLLCTFHKFGLLFLKFHIEKLGRENNFVIIDSDDKKKALKKIAKELKIDLHISFIASEISKYKNSLLNPKEVVKKAELPEYKKVAKIYQEYQKELEVNNLVDFDDLLMLTYEILDKNPTLREEISQKYQYIMVDEYQDTNELQFRLLQHLSSTHNNICVVGDDDQSIYGWRGANINNILDFPKIFEGTKVVKLETNYRSTKPILDSANQLIEHNNKRLGKKLVSHRGDGEAIELIHSIDENMEASVIAQKIQNIISDGVNPREIAVLYRVNALSRSLEEGFSRANLPFKLIGGMRFYERAEIKDVISYLRVIANSDDDFSLLRIINKPKRGIGKSSLDKLILSARNANSTLFSHIVSSLENGDLPVSNRVQNSLRELIQKIKMLQDRAKSDIANLIELFEESIGVKQLYQAMADGEDRVRNIDEFYGRFREYITQNPTTTLDEFLNDISLQSDQDNIDGNAVTIMSIHASKGLEFEYIFIIGLEEEFFPLLGEGCDIEEERRLGYVAITRAKSHLHLSYVDSRFYKGKRKFLIKSRFLGELGIIKNSRLRVEKSSSFKKGDLVKHPHFGIGRVQAVNKSGRDYKLLINFGGNKKEILSPFVKLI